MHLEKIIGFSDLDGSLLNYGTYKWTESLSVINELKIYGFTMVINSSKTCTELKRIREKCTTDPFTTYDYNKQPL